MFFPSHIGFIVKRLLPCLLFLLPVLGAGTLEAQDTVQLSGLVYDGDGRPLQYAHVVARSLQPVRGALTDSKGRYRLTLPADSAVSIRVSYTGFGSVDTVLRFKPGSAYKMNVRLERSSERLMVVKIVVEKSRTTPFTYIDVDRIENNVGPQAGVESLLKTLPDVSSNNEMSSQYSVRGGSFDENLVYINHVEIYRPILVRNGQQEGTSIINPDLVDNIYFSPGGFDALYGDRMSSALDITYRRPQQFKGRASASLLGASL